MRLDALTLELLRNYLHGAVEDMAYAVERTAHTTFVKETADFTCGLLTPAGDFFAYPVELGVASMAGISYARTLEAVGPLEPGDVVITNDPYGSAAAATHLPDLHLVRPIFWEGRLVGHGAGFLHCSDIGGLVPASISPRASEIFQEGLRLPPKKLFVRGVPNRDLLDVILANCRIPEQNWGDLRALVAGLTTGERRVHELIRRFGSDTVDKAMDDLIDYSARKVEALIRRMPEGRYEFSDRVVVLHAGSVLDAGGYVHPEGPEDPDRFAHVGRAETARETAERPAWQPASDGTPLERHARAAHPVFKEILPLRYPGLSLGQINVQNLSQHFHPPLPESPPLSEHRAGKNSHKLRSECI